jgi:hypothetical protein
MPGRLRQIGASLKWAWIGIFTLSLLLAAGSLMEGVTHRYGEGQVGPVELPEQARSRQVLVTALGVVACLAWMPARLAERSDKGALPRLGARRLLAESLLVQGGIGLGLAILVWWGGRLAAYRDLSYHPFGIGAAVGGATLLALGGILYRWWARVEQHP